MKIQKTYSSWRASAVTRAGIALMALAVSGAWGAQPPLPQATHGSHADQAASPCGRVEVGPLVRVAVGKSTVVRPQTPVTRILLGNPENAQAGRPVEGAKVESAGNGADAASGATSTRRPGVADVDVLLLSSSEIYLLGKTVGSTNVVLLDRSGTCTVVDVSVGMDTVAVQATINELLPGQSGIKVTSAADSLVLTGIVSDAGVADQAVDLATAYVRRVSGGSAGGSTRSDRVLNMLSVSAPQQVMLEVKVAEISKTLLDQFGINFARAYTPADGSMMRFINGIFGGQGLIAGQVGGTTNALVGGGVINSATNGSATAANTAPIGNATINGSTTTIPLVAGKNATTFGVDAQKQDGLVKVLAEPTVMAISGQEGSFLAGGKLFIPIAQSNSTGGVSVSLEEKEFGVSLKFLPTVLADGRINLKVNPEVSELSSTGVTITSSTTSGQTILPTFTTRRASTTVQLLDGQSFAIGGLIKNNVTANISAFPFLGELPVIGALFRSHSFQTDRSELVFVITPRLVKPLPPNYALPTDGYVPPSRSELLWGGKLEGSAPPVPPASAANGDGFEVK